MSRLAEAITLSVLVVSTSVWIGGYVAIIVVARVASRVLDESTRVPFFRALGRAYFWVGSPGLIIAMIAGAVLARNVTHDGLYSAIAAVSAVLLVSFALAVSQARRMTRLRQSLLTATSEDAALRARIRNGATAASMLRALLGLLSLVLVVLGSFLAIG